MRNYWQRKPLLIRQAFPGCSNGGTPLVSKEELLNLACAEDVESRIIQGFVAPPGGEARWQLSSGPFEEADFSRVFFGKVPWTLLVNEVNRHVPEASDLLQRFAFLPSWRIDDLMVSYAPRGGGVGPHVDSYDVFLLQVAGTRQWSIETQAISTEAEVERLVPGIDVRILKGFQEDHTWTLNPGDMLYLPPRVPHHGVSLDDECITYSVGFRAPSHRELITYFADAVTEQRVAPGDMYADAPLGPATNPGLIDQATVAKMRAIVRESLDAALDDDIFFTSFLGKLLTTSKRDHGDYPAPADEDDLSLGFKSSAEVISAIKAAKSPGQGPFLYRAEGLCFAYAQRDGGSALFVDGKEFVLPNSAAFAASLLCANARLTPGDLAPVLRDGDGDFGNLLDQLLKGGYLYPADD